LETAAIPVKLPVAIYLLKSALLIRHLPISAPAAVQEQGHEYKKERTIRYPDIESVILAPTGVQINTKV
jgi:hypothetical protein